MFAGVWPYTDPHALARFTARTLIAAGDDCSIWTGELESDGGYGRYRPPHSDVIGAHRWSYLHHHGPTSWPVIRHRCDIRPCVNPTDLEAGTQAANLSDTVARGGWTTIARHGPASWPTLAFRLRTAERASDRDLVRQLTARPRQLALDLPDGRLSAVSRNGPPAAGGPRTTAATLRGEVSAT